MQFARQFAKLGINVNAPEYGAWVEEGLHRGFSYEYNADWAAFFEQGAPSAEETLEFGRSLAGKYGFDVHF